MAGIIFLLPVQNRSFDATSIGEFMRYLDSSLDGSVVLGPPVQAFDAIFFLFTVPAERRLAFLLRFR